MKKRNRIQSEKKSKVLSGFVDILCFIVGASIYAVGVNMFSVPNNIASGGATGISVMLNYLFPVLPVGMTILAINIPLFILAFIFLGRKLFAKSFIATIILSVMIDVLSKYVPAGTDDKILASLFYGITSGIGLALIFSRNATSGGSDIIAKLINKYFPHVPMGRAVFFVDCLVVITAGIVYGNIESSLYAAIVVFVCGEVIDMILYGMSNARTFLIVTTKPEEMSQAIFKNANRGVTVLPVKGGYTHEEKSMLVCAVRNSEASKINKTIREIDDQAFTIITEAGEILGKGFKANGGGN